MTFRIKKIADQPGFYRVAGGKIAGKYYPSIRVAGRSHALDIAEARNRLVQKKAAITRRVRKTRREA